jgi:hypothetical protein
MDGAVNADTLASLFGVSSPVLLVSLGRSLDASS